MKPPINFLIILTALLSGCGQNQNSQNGNYGQMDPTVQIVGAMRNVMHNGELSGTISLDTISNKEHLYGLGPVEYLRGELLIVDGKSYVSTASDTGNMMIRQTWNVKAPFFVYANVRQWEEVHFPDSVLTIQQLESYLNVVTADRERPFAFKLNAIVSDGDIHIVNLPAGTEVHSPEEAHQNQQSYKVENEEVEMTGFFSTQHQGIFTHHDSYVHIHLMTADKLKMGHLDRVRMKPGTAKLFLPAQ